MSFKIDRIRIQSFRGIRHPLTLTPAGQNLIIVGENGSGKSSIIDALEYYFTGQLEKLSGRQDINERQAIPNLAGGPTTVAVSLQGRSGDTFTRPYPNQDFSVPASWRSFFDLTVGCPFILRRAQILDFINARPAARYEQISKLIGLGELDRIDAVWRGKKVEAQKRVAHLRESRKITLNALSGLLAQQIGAGPQVLAAVNEWLKDCQLEPIAVRQELPRRQGQLRQLLQAQSAKVRQERLRALRQKVASLDDVCAGIIGQQRVLSEKLQIFWQQSGAMELAPVEKLLAEGYRILHSDEEISACPLCGTPIPNVAALLDHLQEKLDSLQTVAQARQEAKDWANQLYERLVVFDNQLRPLAGELVAEELSIPDLPIMQERITGWQGALKADRWLADQGDMDGLFSQFQQALAQIAEAVAARMETLSFSAETETLFDLQNTLSRVDEQWQRLEENDSKLRWAEYVGAQLDIVYDQMLAARRRGLQRLTETLEADLISFYQKMHPNERYGKIAIPIHEERRSSVDLGATYYDLGEVHPLNYFSEGHLDSLGLCIFLAFIKHFNSELKLIFLDDVLTTVDAGHRLRVARLLAQEFADYQFIITTHDQVWARHLTQVIPQARLISLRSGWTLDQGADCLETPVSDWAFYEEQARNGRCPDAIAGAGRNLEKFLVQMRRNLRLSIPAKPNEDYTIGDLYGPFFQWVNRHEIRRPDRPAFSAELTQLQNQLDDVWRMRNWAGAHFNEWATTVTANEAIGFITVIRTLVDSFACPACSNLVYYNSEAKVLLCRNCRSVALTRLVWEYEPGWHKIARKLLQANKPQVRRSVTPLVQSRLRSFLRDMRRRLSLPVMATPDDEYDMVDLYHPFFTWVENRPRVGIIDWTGTIQQVRNRLDQYWPGEQWQEIADDEVIRFTDTVRQLTELFECQECLQLLNYDVVAADYICANCGDEEASEQIVAACWFVQ